MNLNSLLFFFDFCQGEEGKKYFNTGLLNLTSLMANLRLQTAAHLMGPMLHCIKYYIAKTSFLDLWGHFNDRIGFIQLMLQKHVQLILQKLD